MFVFCQGVLMDAPVRKHVQVAASCEKNCCQNILFNFLAVNSEQNPRSWPSCTHQFGFIKCTMLYGLMHQLFLQSLLYDLVSSHHVSVIESWTNRIKNGFLHTSKSVRTNLVHHKIVGFLNLHAVVLDDT